MSQINPYEPPRADDFPSIRATLAGGPDGIYRMGHVLVVRIGTVLPPVCLKSNEPTPKRWRRTFSWHPPWVVGVVLLGLLGLLVYVILGLVLTKRATFDVPINDYWRSRRRRGLLIGWLIVLAGIAMFIVGLAVADATNDGDWIAITTLLGLIGMPVIGFIVGSFASRLVWPAKIDDYFIHFKGVSPQYLAKLPQWTGR